MIGIDGGEWTFADGKEPGTVPPSEKVLGGSSMRGSESALNHSLSAEVKVEEPQERDLSVKYNELKEPEVPFLLHSFLGHISCCFIFQLGVMLPLWNSYRPQRRPETH